MDYESLYVLNQSRKTLLKILAGRGYVTAPYEKFGPFEVSAMAFGGPDAMRMDLERPAEAAEAEDAPEITKCRVLYSFNRIKNRLSGFVNEITDEENEDRVDPATTEVIVMLLNDTIAEAFHVAALSAYANKKKKLRISFFQVHQLVNNPLEHVLVPKHERLPGKDVKAFLAEHKIKGTSKLPIIKFHEDMIARLMGLMPEDIVKITAASPSAGEYVKYRVCRA